MAVWRLTVHGDSSRGVQGRIAEAFDTFLKTIETIDDHGIYLAQFEGSHDFRRFRGEDNTMLTSEGSTPEDNIAPAIFHASSGTNGSIRVDEVPHG